MKDDYSLTIRTGNGRETYVSVKVDDETGIPNTIIVFDDDPKFIFDLSVVHPNVRDYGNDFVQFELSSPLDFVKVITFVKEMAEG